MDLRRWQQESTALRQQQQHEANSKQFNNVCMYVCFSISFTSFSMTTYIHTYIRSFIHSSILGGEHTKTTTTSQGGQ